MTEDRGDVDCLGDLCVCTCVCVHVCLCIILLTSNKGKYTLEILVRWMFTVDSPQLENVASLSTL